MKLIKTIKTVQAEVNACQKCEIGSKCRNHVPVELTTGLNEDSQLDILIIGEAPGSFEDIKGKPFVGPAGKLLRWALKDAEEATEKEIFYAITNTVACRPTEGVTEPNREPTLEERNNCMKWVMAYISILRPKTIILVGSIARDHYVSRIMRNFPDISVKAVTHPAYFLYKKLDKDDDEVKLWRNRIVQAFEGVKARKGTAEKGPKNDLSTP